MIRACGGLVVRDGRLAVVHRPKYDDWSLPKGKAKPDERDEDCALREIEEETGLRVDLGEELATTTYLDAQGRPKRVRWWLMTPRSGGVHTSEEVDELRWLTPAEARELLTYARDVELLDVASRRRRAALRAAAPPPRGFRLATVRTGRRSGATPRPGSVAPARRVRARSGRKPSALALAAAGREASSSIDALELVRAVLVSDDACDRAGAAAGGEGELRSWRVELCEPAVHDSPRGGDLRRRRRVARQGRGCEAERADVD